ncbi:MAG: rhodanese-like domain-containing protein [Saprospiraceae bacterium]|nr:rhodanese-like domain-containing protein [Saprospiraceae bacterium]
MKKAIIEQECIASSEAKEKLMAGNTIQIIDVRSPEEFAEKHISEAINIPLDELEHFLSKLDKSLFFVTACGKGGGRSSKGAEILREGGFRAAWLCGGTFGWFD